MLEFILYYILLYISMYTKQSQKFNKLEIPHFKVIRLAGIICDHETEMLIPTMYLKMSNILRKYLNTNTFHS